MRSHYPKGRSLPALERNILKYRAFEMLIMLFHIEDLKAFVSESHIVKQQEQQIGAKKKYKNRWEILVENEIISQSDSDEIQRLLEYRNDIAHRIHQLTYDLSREPFAQDFRELYNVKYDYEALKKLKQHREKISSGFQSKSRIFIARPEPWLFEATEKTYQQEMARLSKKITRQIVIRKGETQKLNAELSTVDRRLLNEIDPAHPLNIAGNGTLTKRGVESCYRLFDQNVSALAVAHLMRISYRAVMNHHRAWQQPEELGGIRQRNDPRP